MPVLSQYAFCVNKQNQNLNLLLKLRSGDVKKRVYISGHITDIHIKSFFSRLLAKTLLYCRGAGGDMAKSSRVCCGCAYKLAINTSQTQTPLCSLVS